MKRVTATALKHYKGYIFTRPLMKSIKHIESLLQGLIVRNAISLYGSTIVTSILGFFYWFIAARMVPARAVGTASAIQSAAQFLSIFCVLGLSTLLVSELAKDKSQARGLILTAVTVAGLFSLATAAFVGIGLRALSSALRPGLTGTTGIVVFVALATFTTILMVLDFSCIGLLRGDLQFRRNTVFAVSKLLFLPLLIIVWPVVSGTELVLAWLAGLAVSLVTLGMELRTVTRGQRSHLDFRDLFQKRHLMAKHHTLNLSIQSPNLVIPVLVAIIISPEANAAYTAAALTASFVNIIPVHLSTVLFALTPGDEAALQHEVRKTMRICLILALLSAPFFLLFSGFILGFFGPSYVVAATALAILGLTTYPLAIKSHYVAISRVRGRMHQAAVRTTIGACLEVGLAALGATLYGVTGVAAGFLIATLIEAAIFSSVVFGVLRAPPLSGTGEDNPDVHGPTADRTGQLKTEFSPLEGNDHDPRASAS